MSEDDKRNTLIVELSKHSIHSVSYFQSLDNGTLIDKRGIVVLLLEAGIRNMTDIVSMSVDDQRNTMIVENAGHTHFFCLGATGYERRGSSTARNVMGQNAHYEIKYGDYSVVRSRVSRLVRALSAALRSIFSIFFNPKGGVP